VLSQPASSQQPPVLVVIFSKLSFFEVQQAFDSATDSTDSQQRVASKDS